MEFKGNRGQSSRDYGVAYASKQLIYGRHCTHIPTENEYKTHPSRALPSQAPNETTLTRLDLEPKCFFEITWTYTNKSLHAVIFLSFFSGALVQPALTIRLKKEKMVHLGQF
jgi:hypothetical protein